MDSSESAVIETNTSRKTLSPIKRRYRSPELKRQIVEESLVPGASVARVARAHGVNANQVFAWRRLYQRGSLPGGSGTTPGLLAVRVAGGRLPQSIVLPPRAESTGSSAVEPSTAAARKGRFLHIIDMQGLG